MNITDVLDECHVDYETEGRYCREGWLQLNCPWCGGGSDPDKPYLGIATDSLAVNCWVCGRHKIIDTLVELTGKSYRECRDLLGWVEYKEGDHLTKSRGTLKLPENLGELHHAHKRYLEDRGFSPDKLVNFWEIRGIGKSHVLPWRVFIPFFLNGKMVSWTTRSIADDVPARYWSARPNQESVDHKTILGGEDFCRNSVLVCEGPLSAMAVGPGAVWTSGLNYKQAQVLRMVKFARRVICFDAEPEAQKVAEDLIKELKLFPGETHNVVLEQGKDPAECLKTEAGRRELKKLRQIFLEK